MIKQAIKWTLLSLAVLFLSVYLIRAFSEKQIDDVSPLISCDEELLEKVDAYYVIPEFKNTSIAENKSWCEKIKSKNKSLRMHGIFHTFNEFQGDISEEQIKNAMAIFYDCFGFYPERFKAPQEEINEENKKLVEKAGLKLDHYINAVFHKIYHCSDTGKTSNKFNDFF